MAQNVFVRLYNIYDIIPAITRFESQARARAQLWRSLKFFHHIFVKQ